MSHLNIKVPGAPAREATLGVGTHCLGRAVNTDLQLADASVSQAHCQITITDDAAAWRVKDLGSTNGTFIDGRRVTEAYFATGQILRLGQVEILRDPDAPSSPAEFDLPPGDAPLPPPLPGASTAPSRPKAASPATRVLRPKTRGSTGFYRRLPGAFLYPLQRNGLALLLGGALGFGLLKAFAHLDNLTFIGGLGALFAVMAGGYLFAFLQSVTVCSSQGDDEIPGWPDFDNVWDSIARPFLQAAAIFLASMAPLVIYALIVRRPELWVVWALTGLGLFYLPMNWLAVCIYDSVLALNPLLLATSILKAPRPYLACFLLVAAMAAGTDAVNNEVARLLPGHLAAPLITEFLFLYAVSVQARLLGLFYFTCKKKLSWKLS